MDFLEGQTAGTVQWRHLLVVAGIHVFLVLALLYGLAGDVPVLPPERQMMMEAIPVQPAPQPLAHHAARRAQSRAATSRVAQHVEATPIVAPPLVIPTPTSPVVAAPVAGQGLAGASAPGTGDGGPGSDDGAGDGITPSRQIGGRITADDYPRALYRAGVQGRLSTRYTVGTDGRITDCIVTSSSGVAELDALTCRLIRERYRYEPARDCQGRPVQDVWEKDHIWALGADGPR